MQGDGQTHIAVLAQAIHARDDARGAHGDLASGEAKAQIRGQQANRLQHIGIIQQRLAHAHEDDIGDHAPPVCKIAQRPVREPDLADDLGRAEVPVEALLRGGTKAAVQRTAGLRGDTERAAALFRDEHRLDGVVGIDPEQPFAGPVPGALLVDDGGRPDLGPGPQLGAQGPGQIGHAGKVSQPMMINPFQRLVRVKRLVAVPGEPGPQTGRVIIQQIEPRRGHHSGARGQISPAPKKKASSRAALAALSEPWMAFSWILPSNSCWP